MIFAIAIAALVIVGVVLYAHHKHLGAIAEVKVIAETVRRQMILWRLTGAIHPATPQPGPDVPKVVQP